MAEEQHREELELFVSLIMDTCGVRFTRARLLKMERAIESRVKDLGLGSISDYYQCVTETEKGGEELTRLSSLIVRAETGFFKESALLERVADHAAELVITAGSRNGKPLARVWFPVCGTGEEVYTFAVMVAERLRPEMLKSVEILGTDGDRENLKKAFAGTYEASALGGVKKERLGRFFQDEGHRKKVSKEVMSMVSFGLLDLVNGIYPSMLNGTSGLNIVVFRNFLTFFNWKVTERIASKFQECLVGEGLLLVGKGEKMPPVLGWELVESADGRLYRKKELKSSAGQKNPTSVRSLGKLVLQRRDCAGQHGAGARNLFAEKAQEYLSIGDTRKALITLTEAISSGADDARVHLWLADLFASRNDLGSASEQCLKSLEKDPACAEAYLLLGIIHMREGHYRESMESLRKALFINPEDQKIRLHVARALDGMGRSSAARKVYRRIISEGKDEMNSLVLEVAKKALGENSTN
jgi:chemotaxis methyl-accepting protein methylase/Flp pilus assembly protein TadD